MRYSRMYWQKCAFLKSQTFAIIEQWGTGKLSPSHEVLFISSTLIIYALDHIRTARYGLRDLHEIDPEWDIVTCAI